MSGGEKSGTFVSRWSRRKLAIEAEEADNEMGEGSGGDETAGAVSEPAAEPTEEQLANQAAAEAVDLETLTKDTDFSIFLKDGVSPLLRKQAMAALWRSDPVFANVDGLVEYGENFADPKLIMKSFTSAYQAGRGYLKVLEEQAKSLSEAVQTEESAGLPEADDEPEEQAPTADLPVETAPPDPAEAPLPDPTEETADEVVDVALAVEERPRVPLRQRLGLSEG